MMGKIGGVLRSFQLISVNMVYILSEIFFYQLLIKNIFKTNSNTTNKDGDDYLSSHK